MLTAGSIHIPVSYLRATTWKASDSFWVIKIWRYGLKHGNSLTAAVESAVATVMLASSRSASGPYRYSPEAQTKQSRGNTHLQHKRVQHFCQAILVRSPVRLFGVTAIPPSFMLLANVERVHSDPASRSLMKMCEKNLAVFQTVTWLSWSVEEISTRAQVSNKFLVKVRFLLERKSNYYVELCFESWCRKFPAMEMNIRNAVS